MGLGRAGGTRWGPRLGQFGGPRHHTGECLAPVGPSQGTKVRTSAKGQFSGKRDGPEGGLCSSECFGRSEGESGKGQSRLALPRLGFSATPFVPLENAIVALCFVPFVLVHAF